MPVRFLGPVLAALTLFCLSGNSSAYADDFMVDAVHSGVTFKISHLGLSWVQGRFDEFGGQFTVNPADPSKCSFELNIKADSIDTNNAKRDGHLKSGDFFNTKQFPAITFKSSAVTTIKDGYQVTGAFTMHGVTKQLTFPLMGGRQAEFPKGKMRTGFTTELTLKRSDFGMDKMQEAIGDNVHVTISIEGTKK